MSPRPSTVLAFGLGSLLVPAVEVAVYRLCGRHPLDPSGASLYRALVKWRTS